MKSERPGAQIRGVAALPTGVHAVPTEQATGLLMAAREPHEKEGAGAAGEPPPIVWIDVSNPGDAEAAYLRDELKLHPLAVEDCVRGRQRPKVDRYTGYYFVVFYAASFNVERGRMALNEVHLFLGERFLITVHDHRVAEVGEIIARWRATPHLFEDVGALAHALLDALVDDYFPVLEHVTDEADRLERHLVEQEGFDVQRVFRLRHELMLFRRVVSPERDVLSSMLRRDLPFLRPELLPYFQDVYDHAIRVVEEIDSQRELLASVLEAHRAESANVLNQTVRMLTGWSIILMSVTLIAGIYGMNFEVMPELGWRWGYPFAIGLMLAVGFAISRYFHRRGWL